MTDVAEDDAAQDDTAVPESSEGPKQQSARAPYMSYRGFRTLVGDLRQDGIPGRFDKSYFGGQSGSLIAQTRGTLRYFDLIDDQQHPTDTLTALVTADNAAAEKAVLRKLLEAGYPDALALSLNATAGQLADVFRQRGLSGATVQKAIAFYVSLADEVGVEVSPHFRKGRVTTATGNGARKRSIKVVRRTPPPPPVAQTTKPPTEAEQRAAYVEMLMTLVQKNESNVQESLLDRIEKALGIDSAAPQSRGSDVPQEE
jgi:hypothetical protein